MSPTFQRSFVSLAKDHGWERVPTSYFGYWTYSFRRGDEILTIRVPNDDRVTAVSHHDGSGVILHFTQNKRAEAVAILSTPDPRPAHRDVSNPASGNKFCACGQGFSGANAEARLTDHINNPDPMSTGALLIKVMR